MVQLKNLLPLKGNSKGALREEADLITLIEWSRPEGDSKTKAVNNLSQIGRKISANQLESSTLNLALSHDLKLFSNS